MRGSQRGRSLIHLYASQESCRSIKYNEEMPVCADSTAHETSSAVGCNFNSFNSGFDCKGTG